MFLILNVIMLLKELFKIYILVYAKELKEKSKLIHGEISFPQERRSNRNERYFKNQPFPAPERFFIHLINPIVCTSRDMTLLNGSDTDMFIFVYFTSFIEIFTALLCFLLYLFIYIYCLF